MVLPRIFLLPRVASGGRTLVLVVLLVEPHKIQLLLTYFSVFYISDTSERLFSVHNCYLNLTMGK